MVPDAQTLLQMKTVPELRDATLDLVSRSPQPDVNSRTIQPYIPERDQRLGALAVILDDLDLARSLDTVTARSNFSARILCRRDDVAGLVELVELAGSIENRDLRRLTLAGLVRGIDHREVVPALVQPVKDLPGGQLRDRTLAALALHDDDPLHIDRIEDRQIRRRTLAEVAASRPTPTVVARALGKARRGGDERLLLTPAVEGAMKLGDPELKRRAVRTAALETDLSHRISAFDRLGGCSFRSHYSRYAAHLLWQLPEARPDASALWEGLRQDDTQEFPLVWMAIRHDSLNLTRRLRQPWTWNLAITRIAARKQDPAIARQATSPTDRCDALLRIADSTGRTELADEALQDALENDICEIEFSLRYLLIRIGIETGRGPWERNR